MNDKKHDEKLGEAVEFQISNKFLHDRVINIMMMSLRKFNKIG